MKDLNEIKRFQELAGLLKEGKEPDLRNDIANEYELGGSILSFANPPGLAHIAKISPRAAKALESLNNMMPEDVEIEDLPPRLRAKAEKIESSILKDLGINLDEDRVNEDDYSDDNNDADESSSDESEDTDAMGGINEWAGMSPEHANTFELIDKLKDFKKAGKLNDINFKKAEDYIHKNAADLYYDYPDTVHALKQVFKAIKAGVSTGTEYTVDSVVPAVQKLADELVAKGKYKPEQSKRVVAYAAKHKDELLKRLSSPIQWFNASSEATQHGTR